jgi:hypothetical protein
LDERRVQFLDERRVQFLDEWREIARVARNFRATQPLTRHSPERG